LTDVTRRPQDAPTPDADAPDTTRPAPPGGAAPAADPRYRWVAMAIVLIGTFMVILDTSIVNVALPQIGAEFNTLSGVEWIVTAYLLAVGVSMMATGWFADRFGRKAVFVASLALFTAGSLCCALSLDLAMLVAFRVLQGLGGGALMPLAMAMIYELFEPHERGRAFGIWGIAAMAAPALGPVVGGYLATAASWRWLFLINVPIGAAGVPLAVRLLRDVGFRERRRFDAVGLIVSSTGLVLVLLALSQAPDWGWGSAAFVSSICVGVVLLALFTARSLRVQDPLVEMRIFSVPVFDLTMAVIWCLTIAQFARLVFIPLELETLRGLSALRVGITLTPSALGIAATMPIGGRLTDKIGARVPCTVGMVILAVSFWPLGHLAVDTPLWVIAIWLFVGGLGAGLAMMPNTVAGMNAVSFRLVAQASAVRSLNRQLAGAFGTAILASFLAARIGPIGSHAGHVTPAAIAGYNDLFLLGMWLLLAAFALSLFLPGKEQTLAVQEERRRELEIAGPMMTVE
jgi:EmrB/QacA subfamily drug resistance transporter